MRIRNVKNKEEILNNCSFLIENPKEYKGKFKELFANDNPIYLDIVFVSIKNNITMFSITFK